jgi:flavin reductase (DIM6/NTAB) family NADH-FMN oxidoreductase RutF
MTVSERTDGLDARHYRALMREVSGAVTIVAAGAGSDRSGLTATAVCSVSDQPPTLLVCLNRGSQTLEVIRRTGSFTVNVLAGTMTALAEQFAGRTGSAGGDKFSVGEWSVLCTGAPALSASLATLDCNVAEVTEVATHAIVFGHVVAGTRGPGGPALLYARGGYWSVGLE